jgi:hypothetical protein
MQVRHYRTSIGVYICDCVLIYAPQNREIISGGKQWQTIRKNAKTRLVVVRPNQTVNTAALLAKELGIRSRSIATAGIPSAQETFNQQRQNGLK